MRKFAGFRAVTQCEDSRWRRDSAMAISGVLIITADFGEGSVRINLISRSNSITSRTLSLSQGAGQSTLALDTDAGLLNKSTTVFQWCCAGPALEGSIECASV